MPPLFHCAEGLTTKGAAGGEWRAAVSDQPAAFLLTAEGLHSAPLSLSALPCSCNGNRSLPR